MAVAPTCYRVADLAERWSCSHSKIRILLRDGVLPILQLGTMIRIPIAAVEEYEIKCQTEFTALEADKARVTAPVMRRLGRSKA